MKSRTRARCVALQALYEIDLTGHNPQTVIEERLNEEPLDDHLASFARKIVLEVSPIFSLLDKFIAQHAPEWPLDQIATIDRNILRMALWEITLCDEIPIKVAINEAVELAKVYGSPRFVNGVLGSLANHENEIKQALKRILQKQI